jgi:hypothetical protein
MGMRLLKKRSAKHMLSRNDMTDSHIATGTKKAIGG